MKAKKLLKKETKRLLAKAKFNELKDSDFTVVGYQLDENFTTVLATHDNRTFLGHAKLNPTCDHYDVERGLVIALSRAIEKAVSEDDAVVVL